MKLHPPFMISSRLMAGVEIGGATISIDYGSLTSEGRYRYSIYIDLPGGVEHFVDDLKSGVGGGSLQQGMASLLSFLGAAAESYCYRMSTGRQGENEDLFPPDVVEWAYQNDDEISSLAIQLEEGGTFIEEDS